MASLKKVFVDCLTNERYMKVYTILGVFLLTFYVVSVFRGYGDRYLIGFILGVILLTYPSTLRKHKKK